MVLDLQVRLQCLSTEVARIQMGWRHHLKILGETLPHHLHQQLLVGMEVRPIELLQSNIVNAEGEGMI
jgi:hypothetical protein